MPASHVVAPLKPIPPPGRTVSLEDEPGDRVELTLAPDRDGLRRDRDDGSERDECGEVLHVDA